MEQQELTEKNIGCAYNVYNTMGSGFFESVYENSLMIELRKAGLEAKNQQPITVKYSDEVVGEFIVDIVVEDLIIVELKAV
ncbi:MAG: GxxExxY protein [Cellvibrionaceae bacterium]|jgi:GxxExxY protein